MSDTRKRAREIFEIAIEIADSGKRDDYLNQVCAQDQNLLQAVKELLQAHDQATGILASREEDVANDDAEAGDGKNTARGLASTSAGRMRGEKTGDVVAGKYRLLEQIGEGGMGSVWVAEQARPVKRRVAIKMVKAGMDSKQVLSRFDAERQALAVMDHPNIAKVFDGGLSENGRPYFAMEYVKGIPITEYCDQARVSLQDRLQLFLPVCSAVQHAHQKGIVHRDLKPSNILICLYDGKPVPKVIDFGLAKAMNQSLTEHSIYTAHAMTIGTPLYMSPEQTQQNNLDIDTRTDIYSLGVVLYEVLTGTTPIEQQQFKQAAFEEVFRLIREVEPARPSIRLSGSENLPSIAALRNVDPKLLQRSLAGDLDWIVMKALEKERSRRYETATSLSRDIERYLNEEAIEARPPSTGYRMRKFVRKHRLQVIAASLVLLALIVGISGTTWGWLWAVSAEKQAKDAEEKATTAYESEAEQRKLADEQKQLAIDERKTAEENLINGILRPIGFYANLDSLELRSFRDLAALEESRLRLLAIHVALKDPETALRFARRAERFIQACVGADLDRRAAAIQFVSAKQRDTTVDARIRVAACWYAMALGSSDLPALEESYAYLSVNQTRRSNVFGEFIDCAVGRTDPAQRDRVATSAWKLVDALTVLLDSETIQTLYGLDSCFPLPRALAQNIANTFIGVIEEHGNIEAILEAVTGLTVLAPHLSADQAQHGWNALIQALRINLEARQRMFWSAHQGLVALFPRLSQEQARSSVDALIGIVETSSNWYELEQAVKALEQLAPQLSSKQAARASAALLGVLTNPAYAVHPPSRNSRAAWHAFKGFVAMQPSLTPEQQFHELDSLIDGLADVENTIVISDVQFPLADLAPRFSTAQTERLWSVVSSASDSHYDLFGLLSTLVPRLPQQTVESRLDVLISTLGSPEGDVECYVTCVGLDALAPHLSPEQAMHCWDVVNGVFDRLDDPDDFEVVGQAIAALGSLAPSLTAAAKQKRADALIIVLEEYGLKTYDISSSGVAEFVPHLNPDQAMRAWELIVGVYDRLDDFNTVENLDGVLSRIATHFSSTQAQRALRHVLEILETCDDYITSDLAGSGLVALMPTLSDEQAKNGLDALLAFIERSRDAGAIGNAVYWMVTLSAKLSPEQAKRGWNALVTILKKDSDEFIGFPKLHCGFPALWPRLADEQKERCLRALIERASKEPSDLVAFEETIKGLAGVAPSLSPSQMQLISPTFIDVLGSSKDEQAIQSGIQLLLRNSQNDSAGYATVIQELFALYAERNADDNEIPNQLTCVQQLAAMQGERELARLLSHPGCVGEFRINVLRRFEELVLYDGQPVFSNPLIAQLQAKEEADENEADATEAGESSADVAETALPPRRFHTVYDAAAWINENWPDFDYAAGD